MSDLARLRDALRVFTAERDWGQFHSPKNLAIGVSVEASELLEVFQWCDDAASRALDAKSRDAASAEIADVLLYLLLLSDALGIDPIDAATRKMEENARKYPVDKARGTSRKYDAL